MSHSFFGKGTPKDGQSSSEIRGQDGQKFEVWRGQKHLAVDQNLLFFPTEHEQN